MSLFLLLLSHFSHVRLCATPSLGFSRQEHWRGWWVYSCLVKVKVLVAQSCPTQSCQTQLCPTVCDPMDSSLPGSSVCGTVQARILEWVALPFSRDLPDPRIELRSSALQADLLPSEPLGKPENLNKMPGTHILSTLPPHPFWPFGFVIEKTSSHLITDGWC